MLRVRSRVKKPWLKRGATGVTSLGRCERMTIVLRAWAQMLKKRNARVQKDRGGPKPMSQKRDMGHPRLWRDHGLVSAGLLRLRHSR
jgi:hypothetical protein